ncbi:hypothetical protein CPB84DRAFT_1733686 [Gymnopilus junonius]|uniref:Tyrosinase C-terminal domain-containing protein n=1 Tax=Gymnopilus junonius TaxID=109634 RepID=A0A9P5TKP4_GYMJU|nr:hypothetical protein CPB84DRAFT_1733686 [Gymnopilus junonius]
MSSTTSSTDTEHADPYGPIWEWTARVHVDKQGLNSAISICLFLGEQPADPKDWLLAPNLAGAHHVLANPGHGGRTVSGYGTRRSQAGIRGGGGDIAEGFVHLNQAIAKHSGLNSLNPEVVVPYLEKELEWRVQKADTTPIEVESLEIVVFATPLTYPPGGMFPVPGKRRQYNHITYGKPGGSRDSEDKL